MTCPSPASPALRCHRSRTRTRLVVAAMLLVVPATHAAAADWIDDTLRGSYSSAPMRWDGIYFGGQIGVGNSDTDFSDTAHQFVASSLRVTALQNEVHPSDWSVLPSQIAHGRSYGGFLGYGMQWDQLVLGAEIAYNRVSGMESTSVGDMTRVVAPSNGTDTVTIKGTDTIRLNDYVTLRARAGFAMGQFLPYAFIGGVVGRFDYSRNLFLGVSGADVGTFSLIDSKSGAIVAGMTTGLGIDVAVTPNVFLRGEWEFNAFAAVAGIKVSTNTGRVGLGVRF
jgi:outer membrane immunogenic protein